MEKTITARKELDTQVKQYILDAISNEGYEGVTYYCDISMDENKLKFLMETFKSEYGFNIKRYGEQGAFKEWLMGLPSAIHIDFENYKILELARAWGSISPDLTGKALERREDMILENWFNFITVKTFQLFRKHGIN